jgi:uncharacterized membrane protein
MDDIALARALHVLSVVIWIGGVWMATTVVFPAARRDSFGADRLKAFRAVERRFVWHARAAVIVVGLSGLYMVDRLQVWDRFQSLTFWWMHAMVIVWLIFALMLFVIGPFVLPRHIRRLASSDPDLVFARLNRVHSVLLTLSVITILGAVAGSHGWSIF